MRVGLQVKVKGEDLFSAILESEFKIITLSSILIDAKHSQIEALRVASKCCPSIQPFAGTDITIHLSPFDHVRIYHED